MKRMRTLCLVAVCCVIMSGCGGGKTPSGKPTATADIALTDQKEADAQTQQMQLMPEQVIYDADGVRITVKGMEENTMTGTDIRVLVENGTDRNLVFSGDLFVVNGITVPGYLYAEVAAGTRTNDAIELYTDVLKSAGIGQIGTLLGYDTRIVDTDTYEILARVPMELTTAYAQAGEFVPEESGVELYRDREITVIAQMITDEFYGKTARLLVKNETGKDIIVEAENIAVNGYTVDAWLYDTVVADTVRYCHLDLFETGLAENGIDQVETISFRLNFLDAVSFETIAQSEVLTVDVKG